MSGSLNCLYVSPEWTSGMLFPVHYLLKKSRITPVTARSKGSNEKDKVPVMTNFGKPEAPNRNCSNKSSRDSENISTTGSMPAFDFMVCRNSPAATMKRNLPISE